MASPPVLRFLILLQQFLFCYALLALIFPDMCLCHAGGRSVGGVRGLEEPAGGEGPARRHGRRLLRARLGGAREPGVPGDREQPCDVPHQLHALLAVAVGDDGDQLHGHGVPARAPRRLPLRRRLHHLRRLPPQRIGRVRGLGDPDDPGAVTVAVAARVRQGGRRCRSLHPVSGSNKAMLFVGLYLTALGVGGIKGSLPSHGAEQFDEHAPRGRKGRSTFFNYFVFCLSCGVLIAVTLVVWVEDNKGWQWGFAISTIAILLSIPVFASGSRFYRSKVPTGSPLATIGKVLLAAALARRRGGTPRAVIDRAPSPTGSTDMKEYSKSAEATEPSQELSVLNRAVQYQPRNRALTCTVQEVEDVKIVLMVLPIFFATIMLNCCLAQLSTFSVEQAATMDTRLGGFKVPAASLQVFPVTFIILLAPIYNHLIIPFACRATGTKMGITHLQRIGTGLVLSIVAMVLAAIVEVKRKNVATNSGMIDSRPPLPITFFWIAFQYLFLGSTDLFTLAGLLEFFFSEAPPRMRSLATSLSWASLALGFYLSSVLVTVVNSATRHGGHRPWLEGASLNHYHLERFYWLMCVLSAINYLFFLVLAIRYKYRNAGVIKG